MPWRLLVRLPDGNQTEVTLADDGPASTPEGYMALVRPHGYSLVSQRFLEPAPLVPQQPPPPPPASNGEFQIPPPQRVMLVSPDGKQTRPAGSIAEFDPWLEHGWSVLRADGSRGITQRFMGGWLIDGHPLNVVLGQGWIEGQQEALQNAVDLTLIPRPTLMLNDPVIPAAAVGLAEDNTVLYIAGGVAVVLVTMALLSGKKRKDTR